MIERNNNSEFDPFSSLVTINCHGLRMNENFRLQNHVYVLVPHPQGLEASFLLDSPPGNISFEELIYNQGDGNLPESSAGNWFLYRPGELIRNIAFNPWSLNKNTRIEYNNWVKRVPKDDLAYVEASEKSIPRFAIVPARSSNGSLLYYKGQLKTKVKVFGTTSLSEILGYLLNLNHSVVLIPFTCNQGENNITIRCSTVNYINISSIFA